MFSGGFGQGGGFHEDMFANFAEMFMGGGKQEPTRRNGQDVVLNMEVDFLDTVKGIEKVGLLLFQTVSYNKRCMCSTCNGSRAKPGTSPQKCNTCQGKGSVNYRQGGFVIRMPCNACDGAGTTIKHLCTSCKGTGLQRKDVS